MAALTQNSPIIQEAYAELERFYANGESREKIKELERFIMDYNIGFTSVYEEGEAKGKVETIILFLTRRFGFVSQEIQDRLLSMADIDQLDHLFDFAQDCTILEEFTSHLR